MICLLESLGLEYKDRPDGSAVQEPGQNKTITDTKEKGSRYLLTITLINSYKLLTISLIYNVD